MLQEEINELYIICTSGTLSNMMENKSLFQKFFRHFLECINLECFTFSNESILNEQTFPILEIMLNHPEIIEYEYCISDILDAIRFKQEKRCWKISQAKSPELNDIDLLLQECSMYQKVLKMVEGSSICMNSSNSIIKSSVNKFRESQIYIYYLDSLTKILGDNYLLIDKEKANYIISLLDIDSWLKELEQNESVLGRDLITKYIRRVLSVKELISEDEVANDSVVRAILHNELRDKKLLKSLFTYLKVAKLFSLFDYKIENLIQFIRTIDYADKAFQLELLSVVVNRCLNEDYFTCLLPIYYDKLNLDDDISLILDENLKKELIHLIEKGNAMGYPEIEFAIESGATDKNFLCNCMFFSDSRKDIAMKRMNELGMLKKETFAVTISPNDSDLDKISKLESYNLTGRVIEQEIAIDLLSKYFHHQIHLDIEAMKAIVRSIITYVTTGKGVKGLSVHFGDFKSYGGFYSSKENAISIDIYLIERFLDTSKKMEDRLYLFSIMFHEMRHALQNEKIENNQFDFFSYFALKERIIREYDPEYYEENYKRILIEIDARQAESLDTIEFFKDKLPDLADVMRIISQKNVEKYDDYNYGSKVYFASQNEYPVEFIFDKIVSLHPSLVKDFPIFQLEYTEDGNLKPMEELESSNEDNIELINELKKRRGDLAKIL